MSNKRTTRPCSSSQAEAREDFQEADGSQKDHFQSAATYLVVLHHKRSKLGWIEGQRWSLAKALRLKARLRKVAWAEDRIVIYEARAMSRPR